MIYNLHCNSCFSVSPAADCCTLLSAEQLWVALNDSVFPPGTVCQALAADAKYNWLSPLWGGCVFALTFCALCLLLTDSVLEELRNISFLFFFLFPSPSFCSSSFWTCLARWSRRPRPGWIPEREEKMDQALMGQQSWMESLQKCPDAHS